MKTINFSQKLSVIGIIILITVTLVSAQNEIQVIACLNTIPLDPKDKKVNINENVKESKDNATLEFDKISSNLFEKLGLKFDVKKTLAHNYLKNDINTESMSSNALEQMNNNLIDSQLRFDLSKTNSVSEANNEFKAGQGLNEQILSAEESGILFDVKNTNTVQELQNDFAK